VDNGNLQIEFKKDHHFDYAQYGGHGEKTISKGYYFVKQDTLLLFHEGIEHPSPSYFEVFSQSDTVIRELGGVSKIGENRASLKLKVVDYSGNAIQSCLVVLMRGDASLSGEVTNENGEASIFTTGRVANKIAIASIGYRNLNIDLEGFWGYSTELKVVLSDSDIEYFEKPFLAKYLITKTGELKLLQKDGTDSKIVMVKD
jgi:hypothetical protein